MYLFIFIYVILYIYTITHVYIRSVIEHNKAIFYIATFNVIICCFLAYNIMVSLLPKRQYPAIIFT